MKLSVLFLLSSLMFVSVARSDQDIKETTQKVEQKITEAADKVAEESAMAKYHREKADYFVLASYSYLDLLIPGKYGLTVGMIQDRDRTWEFEYLKGSLSVPFVVEDLGSMTDERFSLIKRSYFGNNSFNVNYGVTYFDFSIHLGDKLLNRVAGNYPSMDLVEIQALGANVGLGNRWTFDHGITVSVDWISWAQPLIVTNRKAQFLDYTSNSGDKSDVDGAMKIVSYFPRLTFLKLQVGMLF